MPFVSFLNFPSLQRAINSSEHLSLTQPPTAQLHNMEIPSTRPAGTGTWVIIVSDASWGSWVWSQGDDNVLFYWLIPWTQNRAL